MSIPAELASLYEHALPATAYRPAELLRAALAMATTDLDLTDRERRVLDWLAAGAADAALGGPLRLVSAQPPPAGRHSPRT